jgi:hypothetical protein
MINAVVMKLFCAGNKGLNYFDYRSNIVVGIAFIGEKGNRVIVK